MLQQSVYDTSVEKQKKKPRQRKINITPEIPQKYTETEITKK